ncbi:MAG: hypothetical protein RLZZ546_230 [Bacteroidota bacterium]|jgi:hypothetical protein
MSAGKFINLLVAFENEKQESISYDEQAKVILAAAQKSIASGALGVGFIYSANYGQTREIQRTYFAGEWNSNTQGIHQAQVVVSVEKLLATPLYSSLQHKLHILPISTMNAYDNAIPGWSVDLHLGILNTDLDRIEIYLKSGWDVLGLKDQNSNVLKPYAIGGPVAKMVKAENDFIQNSLTKLASNYPQK